MHSEGISSCGVPVVVTDASFGTDGAAASPVDREARYTRVGDSSMVAAWGTAAYAVDDSGGDRLFTTVALARGQPTGYGGRRPVGGS
jgi:hypothetical protein